MPKFTIHFTGAGHGQVDVEAKDVQEAKKKFWDGITEEEPTLTEWEFTSIEEIVDENGEPT